MKDASTRDASPDVRGDSSNSPISKEDRIKSGAELSSGEHKLADQITLPSPGSTASADSAEDQTDVPTVMMPRRPNSIDNSNSTESFEDQTNVPTIHMPRRSEPLYHADNSTISEDKVNTPTMSIPPEPENTDGNEDQTNIPTVTMPRWSGSDSQHTSHSNSQENSGPGDEVQALEPASETQATSIPSEARPEQHSPAQNQLSTSEKSQEQTDQVTSTSMPEAAPKQEQTALTDEDGEITLTRSSPAEAMLLVASQERKNQAADKEAREATPVQANLSSTADVAVTEAEKATPASSGSPSDAAASEPTGEALESKAAAESEATENNIANQGTTGKRITRPLFEDAATAPVSLAADGVQTLTAPDKVEDGKETAPEKVETETSAPAETGSDSEPPSPPATGKRQKRKWPLWARILLGVLAVLIVSGGGVGAYAYYYYENNIQQPLHKIIHPVSRSKGEPTAAPTVDTSNITGRPWNILLLGSDNDNKYTFPAVLTQVMMVIRVDPIHDKVTMVSIPRDSWVNVPDIGGMHKIDQAFFLGASQNNNFDDGVRAARNTIEQDYGIQIDRYAWVGLSGFAKVIDTLGGVDVDVTHPIVDDAYPDDTGGVNKSDIYALKRLYIAPGPQHLNGLQALEYVRSRHADLVGDIGRTQRQQQVLESLKTKLNVVSVLQDLPQLMSDLNGSVYTDLSEQEMISFANYGRTIINNPIQHITLGPGSGSENYGDLSTIYDPSVNSNQDVVIPHCNQIQPVINRVFQLGKKQSCRVNG